MVGFYPNLTKFTTSIASEYGILIQIFCVSRLCKLLSKHEKKPSKNHSWTGWKYKIEVDFAVLQLNSEQGSISGRKKKRAENLWDMKEIHICAVSNKLAQNPTQVGNKFHFNEPRLIKSCKCLGTAQHLHKEPGASVSAEKTFPFRAEILLHSKIPSFIHRNPSWIMDKLRAMQAPSWFLQVLSRCSVFTEQSEEILMFWGCLLFLSPLFLSLEPSGVKPEHQNPTGCKELLGWSCSKIPSWGGAGRGGRSKNPMGGKSGNSSGLEWGQQHEEHLWGIWGHDCGSFKTQGVPIVPGFIKSLLGIFGVWSLWVLPNLWYPSCSWISAICGSSRDGGSIKKPGTIPAEHSQCPEHSQK